ncbi:MAG TPA: MMPL family transporter [Kofleriaceae bacterium]|nr:MMPL family transporter [Kofleriaceae bacterium]
MANNLINRYARWLANYAGYVLLLSVLVAGGGFLLAKRLPVKSDLSSLLPPSQPSVQDLKALQKRARAFGTVFVVVQTPTAAQLQPARAALATELAALPKDLVANISSDSAVARKYFWDNRFLFVSLDDLTAARDGLKATIARINRAKLEANPLFVSFDDAIDANPSDDTANDKKLEDLKKRLHDAEQQASDPGRLESKDGTTALFILQSTFSSSDVKHGKALLAELAKIQQRVTAKFNDGTTVKLTGTVTVSMYEHDSVLSGMALAGLITVLLCGIALWAFYRSGVAVLSVLWALAVGVLATFALTWLFIGQLNVMSAFLTAIVVGNGINAGLMFLARYFEERRAATDPHDVAVLARAIAGAGRGTLAATITALLAYGSLTLTDFRGFRHFGIIAGIGMVACWLAAFTVLPAALTLLDRAGRLHVGKAPRVGYWLARALPFAPRTLAITGIVAAVVFGGVTAQFAAGDPFLKDWRDLQSSSPAINATRELDVQLKATFDPKLFQGLSNQLVLGLDSAEQVAPAIAQLRAIEAKRPAGQELLMELRSVADLVPTQQAEKLAIIDEVNTLLQDDALESLDDEERKTLDALRPPPGLRPLQFSDAPTELSWPFVEQDGSIGRLALLKGSPRFKTWMVDDRLAFAREVRQLPLPANAKLGGESLVIADIIQVMERDAPLLILVALLGAIITVAFAVGFRRHGMVTLFCGLLGVVAMIAVCALIGIRVHFLDLIALPITIGIGIEYAVNIATRDREDGERGPRHVMEQTGGAVALCSFTTMVGYGSLLLSSNGGIRAFGLAAMIGEVTCVAAALVVGPAMLTWLRERKRS